MIRLLGLLGGLSSMTDLGTGSATDESLVRCLVASRFARALRLPDDEVTLVVYASLLEHLGCTAYAHELAAIWGDDIAVNRYAFLTDWSQARDVLRTFVPGVAAETGRTRAGVLSTMVRHGRQVDAEAPLATCEVAHAAAKRLGLPDGVSEVLNTSLASWDGSGWPPLAGDVIPLPTRILHVVSVATLFFLRSDADVALSQLSGRATSQLDPDLVAAFRPDLLDGLDAVDPWQAVLDAEPDPVRLVGPDTLPAVAATFGNLADLKSPWLHGHSAAVGELAGAAAAQLGADPTVTLIAGHLHDLGRVAVSSRIWDKSGPLTARERESVELHPFWTEKILGRVPELSTIAGIAGRHHERCDGSGYHRGVGAADLPMEARVLAAADLYHGLVEGRPHRPALPASDAGAALVAETRAGRLDGDATAAVRSAAGHRTSARSAGPAGLTSRQADVLRLVAVGLSNREVADRLVISRRTAEHHVQDVYRRIGVSSRAGAALFAMEHGLLPRPEAKHG